MPIALITGVGGQDGGYLAERLVAEGLEVHALGPAGETVRDGVHLHEGDLADVATTRDLLLDLAPDEVYNLAAVSSVARSWEEPDLVARVNGFGAVAAMESARLVQARHGREVRFVQASSAEVFGHPTEVPQTELTPVRPTNPYGAAKAYAHLAAAVHRARGLHVSSLVLFNHESPRRPRSFVTRKITAGAADIAAGRADRLVLGNLASERDWGWAPDYVDAMVLAARAESPADYVVATGVRHSVEDFVAAAFRAAGLGDWRPHVEVDPALLRPVDAPTLVGDASRIRASLGWRPTVAFEELVARMVQADLEVPATRP